MNLFDRRWSLQIATLDVSSLDLAFSVERTTKRAPNSATIRVWNLNADARSISETGDPRVVVLRAGYVEDGDPTPVIFVGDVRSVVSAPEGVDWVTTITARDGGAAFSEARLARAYAPGTSVSRPLLDAVDALGIGRGNLAEYLADLTLRGGETTLPQGFVADGPARRTLDALLRGSGLRWSIQAGALQIQRAGEPLATQAVVLNGSTGLVGYPSKGKGGRVSVKTLIQKGLDPGRRVVVESPSVSGEYEISRVTLDGETFGQAWYATLELRPIA